MTMVVVVMLVPDVSHAMSRPGQILVARASGLDLSQMFSNSNGQT